MSCLWAGRELAPSIRCRRGGRSVRRARRKMWPTPQSKPIALPSAIKRKAERQKSCPSFCLSRSVPAMKSCSTEAGSGGRPVSEVRRGMSEAVIVSVFQRRASTPPRGRLRTPCFLLCKVSTCRGWQGVSKVFSIKVGQASLLPYGLKAKNLRTSSPVPTSRRGCLHPFPRYAALCT